jgi:hypothetical protein
MNMTPNPVFKVYGQTDQDYSRILSQVADNLICLIPSRFVEDDIFELERLLNELYAVAYLENWSLDMQNAILDALGKASELGYLIQNPNRNPDFNFFKTLKQFASVLYMLSAHVDCNQDKCTTRETES